jgi:hypothetical protein
MSEITCLALNWQLMSKQPQIVRKLVVGCDDNALSTSIILWSPCSSKNLPCAKQTTETSCMQGKRSLQIKCLLLENCSPFLCSFETPEFPFLVAQTMYILKTKVGSPDDLHDVEHAKFPPATSLWIIELCSLNHNHMCWQVYSPCKCCCAHEDLQTKVGKETSVNCLHLSDMLTTREKNSSYKHSKAQPQRDNRQRQQNANNMVHSNSQQSNNLAHLEKSLREESLSEIPI